MLSWPSRGMVRADDRASAQLKDVIDDELRSLSRLDPAVPDPKDVHVDGLLIHGAGAAVVLTYPLQHPKSGCLGVGSMFARRVNGRWIAEGGVQLGTSCLTPKAPLDLRWARVQTNRLTMAVVYGRTTPAIRFVTLQINSKPLTVPISRGMFMMVANCTGVGQVQALDAHRHSVYQTRIHGCL